MTLISPTIKLCAVCHVPNPMMEVVTLSFFGTQDLDGRCEHIEFMGMKKCWWCGYCNFDLGSKATQKTRDFVRSQEYRWHLKRTDLPGLARTFQCYSVLLEEMKNWECAGHASLVAAWACDDFRHYLGSEYSRARAAALLTKAFETETIDSKFLTTTFLTLVDIYRRLGQFDEAAGVLSRIGEASERQAKIRAMEAHLIAANDTKRYKIDDIPDDLVS